MNLKNLNRLAAFPTLFWVETWHEMGWGGDYLSSYEARTKYLLADMLQGTQGFKGTRRVSNQAWEVP